MSPSPEQIVDAVTNGWQTCETEDELISHVMAIGLNADAAEEAIFMVESGFSSAVGTTLGAHAMSDYDHDPLFRVALRRAAEQIANVPEPPAATRIELETLLKTGDHRARLDAVYELHDSDDRSVIPLLVHALDDESDQIRQFAIQGLGRLRATEAVSTMCKHLTSTDELGIVTNIIIALDKIGDASATPALIHATHHTVPHVRRDAICALATVGDKRALGRLGELATDSAVPSQTTGMCPHPSTWAVADYVADAIEQIESRD